MKDGYYLVNKTQKTCGIAQAELQKEKSGVCVHICVFIYVYYFAFAFMHTHTHTHRDTMSLKIFTRNSSLVYSTGEN